MMDRPLTLHERKQIVNLIQQLNERVSQLTNIVSRTRGISDFDLNRAQGIINMIERDKRAADELLWSLEK